MGRIGREEVEDAAPAGELEAGVNFGDAFEVMFVELAFQSGGVDGEVGMEFDFGLPEAFGLRGFCGPGGSGKKDGGVL